MRMTVQNQIIVNEPTREILEWAEANLVLPNPDYYKKKAMGKWTGSTPQSLYLYERDMGSLILPFGTLKKIWDRYRLQSPISSNFAPTRHFDYQSNINLYPYQQKALEASLKAKNGVLVMPCGSGKTQTGLEYVARIGGKTLWLTHTYDLLNQSKNRAFEVFDCPRDNYGTITAGKVNIGSGITFATVQTMCKLDLTKYKDCWDTIVCDECQHAAGSPTRVTQFYKVISSLSARNKLGLTATPKRADGLEKSMFALLGDIIYEVSRSEVEANTCPVEVQSINTGFYPDEEAVLMGDGTINYSALIDNLVTDVPRLNFVSDVVNSLDGPALVLANRVAYLESLTKKCPKRAICLSTLGTSKAAKQERKEALQKLNSGELDVIFATYQLAKEGLDVPSLRYVVFATPEKDETTVVQSVGRVARKADGKQLGIVIDFVDDYGMYKGWAKKRKGYYKKIGVKNF